MKSLADRFFNSVLRKKGRPEIRVGERENAEIPKPVMDPAKTVDQRSTVLPVVILAIQENKVGNMIGYSWTIPNDTLHAIALLKILEVEINNRVLNTMKPASKIHRV